MLSSQTYLSDIATIKKSFIPKFSALGIRTVQDLLFHIPSRYEDFSHIKSIADAIEGEKATFEGTVGHFQEKKTWKRRMSIFETDLTDDSGTIRLIWFNQKLITGNLPPDTRIRVSGKVARDRDGFAMTSPAFERSSRRPTHTARLVPIYPETYGLTSKFIRWQIEMLFEKKVGIPDPLPESLVEKLHLPTLPRTLRMIHFPKSPEEVEIARKRLAFDDMFLAQLKSLELKSIWKQSSAVSFPKNEKFFTESARCFPFPLTAAQTKAIEEILNDLARDIPMNRLVNGDVGSGKTAVAAVAALRVAQAGFQVALLAPTEVLARQHYETLSKFFAQTSFQIALLTRSSHRLASETVAKETLKNAVKSGLASIVIGTHALIQEDVSFRNLALVIVDEQHRFGVSQRAALQEATRHSKDGMPKTTPHLLTLTATPIPRTLGIALLGNLDISILDEMPKNRLPIVTKIAATRDAKETVFRFARQEIKKGRQVFIILPLVEESATLSEVKAAKTEHEKLSKKVFPEFSVGLLYGKMKPAEKEKTMRDFKEGALHVLVSTSVVEVGVDVPNATVMIIENADRFGLSQLHQFRGRVGRGAHQSYCFLLPGKNSTNDRLDALVESNNGFSLAEKDLEIRGPGAFFGLRQSGIPDIAMSHLGNTRLIKIAQEEASTLLLDDPSLEKHLYLRAALTEMTENVHLE
ncbi:MAG: ATP-dependent DNA helicase RecG [Candidatus Moraniibacteriota bacterium]|nr:MAG: ATP-dependent DNA helicase RecG [Candidatus Moranbacteria bacterium]